MLAEVKQLSIVGVGLLGGSIGLACKRDFGHIEVVGVGRNEKRLQKALELGVLDRYSVDFKEGIEGSDLVVIGSPVGVVVSLYEKVLPYLKPNAIVTDVGSTKAGIVGAVRALGGDAGSFFIGSHPMAGLETSGFEYSSADIYKSSVVLVIKDDLVDKDRLFHISSFWEDLGAKVQFLTKEEHDTMVGLTSHLPHVLSSILSCTLFNLLHFDDAIKQGIFGKGLLDTTRIAGGDVDMWSDIFFSNRTNMLSGIRAFSDTLSLFVSLLENGDEASIKVFLAIAREWRLKLPSFLSEFKNKNNI